MSSTIALPKLTTEQIATLRAAHGDILRASDVARRYEIVDCFKRSLDGLPIEVLRSHWRICNFMTKQRDPQQREFEQIRTFRGWHELRGAVLEISRTVNSATATQTQQPSEPRTVLSLTHVHKGRSIYHTMVLSAPATRVEAEQHIEERHYNGYHPAGYGFYQLASNTTGTVWTWSCSDNCD